MPLFVAVGTAESAAWIDQSRRFARACIDAGNAVELLEVPGAHHFSIGAATAGSMMNERIRAYVAMS
jgi:acetyl esterase/lipase